MTKTFRRIAAALGTALLLMLPVRAADGPTAALTFDDGPSGAQTRALLDILAAENVPATFFLCGYRLRDYPEAAALLAGTVHELGVHGDSHTAMTKLSPEALQAELTDTAQAIEDAAGRAPTLLRPPGGLCNDAVAETAARNGLPIVLWSVDPEDWRPGAQAAEISHRVLAQVKDGSVILLHDLNRATLEALPEIIHALKTRGYTLCTVSELAARRGTRLEPGQCYSAFPPNSP